MDLRRVGPREDYLTWEKVQGAPLFTWVQKQEDRRLATHRPLADVVLGLESCYLADLWRLAQTIPGTTPLEVNTDGAPLAQEPGRGKAETAHRISGASGRLRDLEDCGPNGTRATLPPRMDGRDRGLHLAPSGMKGLH